jgi:alpha-glucosidase (family GH31 glycosyl hydrolase)
VGQSDPEAVLESYHEYIGPSHLPPFWSMGYHQCRWGYESTAALEEMVKKFKEHDLPLDVFWSDLEYMDQKMIFTVNPRTHGGGKLNSIIKDYEVHFVPLLDAGVCLKDTKSIEMGREM